MVAKNALSIRNASQLLTKASTPVVKDGQVKEKMVLPTAKARAAIDYLAGMTPERLQSERVDLKPLVNDLFNWPGTPKGTRTVLRALIQALNTPGKYSQAIELTAFLSSLANVLEADVIARMFVLVNSAENAYAPNRYLVQRSGRMQTFADQFSPERKERILSSLWTEVHRGRWWDISSGDVQHWEIVDEDGTEEDTRLEDFRTGKMTLTKANINFLNTYPQRQAIREYVDQHNLTIAQGKTIEPDIPVLIAFIEDLPPLERAEIPFELLLNRLDEVYEAFDTLHRPRRPDTFLDLFPNLALYGDADVFAYPAAIMQTHNKRVMVGQTPMTLNLIKNSAELGDNRTFMGNCTWSMQSTLKAGTSVLYRVDYQDVAYNIAFHLRNNEWVLREVNSRFNHGNVPTTLREFVNQMPNTILTGETAQQATLRDNMRTALSNRGTRRFRYQV